ncbi:MAG TPA: type I methionyl aminopeptidase [Paludibacteraceae bacterium]|jgi:methionyl aminopeptidase|nr:type I methionyl aminopeptidase [Paludibacteraceae bacterium]HQB68635.1 type I methionyl aminopeptidase [Paludibacteraceae bacterium]HRS67791.1 type I methionyl aminopeptidase [Paludibacteraceae bacterium]
MIYLKTAEEIELLRESNLLVSKTLAELAKLVKPGVTTAQLDKIAEEFIRDHGATPAFKGYGGFPASICTSVNDQVVHGIPSDKVVLKDGDIISIDCGTFKNGFVGDSAYTFCVGEVTTEVKKLLETTKESLYKGIEQAVEGKRIGDIGHAVQQHCESQGYGVVREMIGHGVGRNMHEAPEVPNYGRRGSGSLLKTGMTICIEPMINMGRKELIFESDGWTTRTIDGKYSAHFEHAVAIKKGKADILSDFSIIEQVLSNLN